MDKAIELIEKRVSVLEKQKASDKAAGLHQNMDYYRGAINELLRLKEQLKTD